MLSTTETIYYALDRQNHKGVLSIIKHPSLTLISEPLTPAEAKKCEMGRRDYYSFEPSSNIHTFEIQGQRYDQEDRVVNGLLPGFEALNPEEKKNVLKASLTATEEGIENNIPEDAKKAGTTAICAAADQEGITFGNLGDSALYVVITDGNNKFKNFKRLNTFHQPDETSEIARLANVHSLLTDDGKKLKSLAHALAMSRSLGDTDMEYSGLSHEPEVGFQSYKDLGSENGDKVYMITACDGLKDCLGQSNSEILNQVAVGKQFKKFFNGVEKDLSELLFILARASDDAQNKTFAYAKDNVSVSVAQVGVDGPAAIMMAVFDGHGGSEVSEYCRTHYPDNLETALKEAIDAHVAEENNEKPASPKAT